MKNSGTESCPSLIFYWNLSNIRCSLVGWLCFHPIWWGAGGFLRISHVHKIGCCRGRATAESLQNRTKEATQKSSACGLPSLPPVLLAWLSLRRTQLLLSLSLLPPLGFLVGTQNTKTSKSRECNMLCCQNPPRIFSFLHPSSEPSSPSRLNSELSSYSNHWRSIKWCFGTGKKYTNWDKHFQAHDSLNFATF